MKRSSKIVTIGLGVTLVSYISWWGYHVTHYSEWLSHISIGDSKSKVLSIVGRPVYINTPPDYMYCTGPQISFEYMYGTAVVASWTIIGFNKDNKVICKQDVESP